MIILHNNRFIPEDECRIKPDDRGMTLGDGVFDTMLAIDGKLIWPQEHFARLSYNAAVMKIDFTLEFEKTAQELLQQNNFLQGRYAIRTTVTRGAGGRGLALPEHGKPTILMRASPAPRSTNRVEMVIAATVRRNEHSPLSQIKSLNYGDNILAFMEAQEKGADDAIMLNSAGNVCCATTGNIFIREGETLVTPPLADGVLSGIAREKIISRYAVSEQSLEPERLFEADAVYLTNSIRGTRQVKRIDHTYFRKFEDPILDAAAA